MIKRAPRYRHFPRGAFARLERFFNRLNPGRSPRDYAYDFVPVIEAMAEGRLWMEMSRLSRSAVMVGEKVRCPSSRSESASHYALKHTARAWMREQGADDAALEQKCFVGRADAYSEKHRWAVECGCTAIGKVVNAVQGGTVRFTMIPFQHTLHAETGTAPRPIAINFRWEPSLTEEFNRAPYGRSVATRPLPSSPTPASLNATSFSGGM